MKKLIKVYIRFVQRILITILLSLVYFVLLGITKLFLLIIPNKYFHRPKNPPTFWLKAEGYTNDMNSALEPS